MNGILFDENLPSRITFVPSLPLFHCSDLGPSVSDTQVWEHARQNGYVIVTKGADFSARMMLTTPPPWVVHLRIGNVRRRVFHAFLARVWPQIESLLPVNKLINVFIDRIEAVA